MTGPGMFTLDDEDDDC